MTAAPAPPPKPPRLRWHIWVAAAVALVAVAVGAAYATGRAGSGGVPDVYVAGREDNAQGISVATLWKNGEAQRLSDGRMPAYANSVFVQTVTEKAKS
jgi:hypothetical protein